MKDKLKGLIKKTKPIWVLFQPSIKTIAFIYILAIVMVLQHRVNAFCAEQVGGVMGEVYTTITQNNIVNWLTTLFIVCIGAYISYRFSKGKTYSWIVIAGLFAITYLLRDSDWLWATSALWIDYRWLFVVIVAAIAICGLIPLINKIKNTPSKSKNQSVVSGFSVSTQTESLQDTGWSQYAKNLVSKLLKTNLEKESFAVGISGAWGSGKSTFLSAIREEMQKHVYLLDFNPWNSDSANQISDDFFKSLLSQLSISSYQKHSITTYAKLLGQLNLFSSQSKIVSAFFEESDTSLADAKDKVADVIGGLSLPVVVLIDDLDRLEPAELMAVLRLVRVTANFKNLIFIVAYDKTYVAHALDKDGVENGDEFLKKIFPLEVCLPSFESFVLANHLYAELKESIGNATLLGKLEFAVFKGTANHKISFYLPTFRDVKRFVNQFSLNLNAFVSDGKVDEIDVADLFYLELLHYYDFNAYQQIQRNPQSVLSFTYDIHKKYEYYYRQPGTIKGAKEIEKRDDAISKELAKFKEGVADILWVVFGSSTHKEGDNRARYPNNFSKYFSYRINKDVISNEEFREFLTSETTEVLINRLKDYSRGNVSKRTSLMYHLTSVDLDSTNERQVFNIAYSLIELAMYGTLDPNTSIKQKFVKSKDGDDGIVLAALMKAIRAQIGHYRNSWSVIQDILVSLVELVYDDPSEEEGCVVSYRSVLNWEQLRTLAEENFEAARNQRILPIVGITDEKSRYHNYLERAVAPTRIVCYDGEHDEKYSSSLLMNKLIEIYSKNSHKDEVNAFFANLDPRNDAWYEHGYEEEEFSFSLHRNIDAVFGSTYKDQDFYKFLKAAFADCLPEVNKALKSLGLNEIELDAEKQEE